MRRAAILPIDARPQDAAPGPRNASRRPRWQRLAIRLLAIAALAAAYYPAASMGVASLLLGNQAPASRVASIWFTWWAGDLVSMVLIAPLLIIWWTPVRLRIRHDPVELA